MLGEGRRGCPIHRYFLRRLTRGHTSFFFVGVTLKFDVIDIECVCFSHGLILGTNKKKCVVLFLYMAHSNI